MWFLRKSFAVLEKHKEHCNELHLYHSINHSFTYISAVNSVALEPSKVDMEDAGTPWRDGKYKRLDRGQDLITINGETVTFQDSRFKSKLKYGSFGEADPRIVEMTGERFYNLEIRYDLIGKEMTDYGILTEHGRKMVLKGNSGIVTRLWITDEEAELIENDGDPIEAPPNHYKVEPERQGRLIWISGPPGLGKSTSAQLLSREHGFVYYEADCFFGLRNPYILPDVENPTMAQGMQRKLVGEGTAERKQNMEEIWKIWTAVLRGEAWDREGLEEGWRELYRKVITSPLLASSSLSSLRNVQGHCQGEGKAWR